MGVNVSGDGGVAITTSGLYGDKPAYALQGFFNVLSRVGKGEPHVSIAVFTKGLSS